LRRNEKGHLFSIDANRYRSAYGMDVDKEFLTSYDTFHTLVIAESGRSLVSFVRRIPPIDIFLHDSDHSYHNMTAEFEVAWQRLRPGGFLISDDCNNAALDDFLNPAE